MGQQPRVSVIIPTMGRPKLIKEWIEHIKKLPTSIEIVIIDNNSDDELYDYVVKQYPDVIIVKPKKNIGITPSFWLGAKAAKQDILHFSNDDVFYEKDYFKHIITELMKDDNIGIIGGTMLDRDDSIIQGPCAVNFELNYRVTRKLAKRFANYRKRKGAYDTAAIGGGQLTIKQKTLKKCGNWEPDLFMYGEEVDLALKVKAKNYSIKYVPAAVCRHLHVMQARNVSRSFRFICRNKLYIIRKHFTGGKRTRLLWINLLFFYPRLVLYRIVKPRTWPEIGFIFKGIKEGLTAYKTGKLPKVSIKVAKRHGTRVTV